MAKLQSGRDSAVINMPTSNSHNHEKEQVHLVQAVIEVIPSDIMVIRPTGELVAASFSDSALGLEDSAPCKFVGSSYDTVLEKLPLDPDIRVKLRQHISGILSGKLFSTSCRYPLDATSADELTLGTFNSHDIPGLVFIVLQTCCSKVEGLASRSQQAQLLLAQEEERRRIARDLHDGTAQHLAVAQVMLETLRKARTFEAIDQACLNIEAALGTALHEMRTLSYVLHPPELASGGIVEALSTFLKGFARRTGLNVGFDNLAGQLRPSGDLELALYRVAQEALVNVSKHASARRVDVRLKTAAKHVVLEIEDDGIGIPDDILEGRQREAIGVGLSGMRERVEALGGVFCLERRRTGTLVAAFFPQRRKADAEVKAVRAQRYCSEPHRARVRRSS